MSASSFKLVLITAAIGIINLGACSPGALEKLNTNADAKNKDDNQQSGDPSLQDSQKNSATSANPSDMALPPVEVSGAFLYAGYYDTQKGPDNSEYVRFRLSATDKSGGDLAVNEILNLDNCRFLDKESGNVVVEKATADIILQADGVVVLLGGANQTPRSIAHKLKIDCPSKAGDLTAEMVVNRPEALPTNSLPFTFIIDDPKVTDINLQMGLRYEAGLKIIKFKPMRDIINFAFAEPSLEKGYFYLKSYTDPDVNSPGSPMIYWTIKSGEVAHFGLDDQGHSLNLFGMILGPVVNTESEATKFKFTLEDGKMRLVPYRDAADTSDKRYICKPHQTINSINFLDDVAVAADPRRDGEFTTDQDSLKKVYPNSTQYCNLDSFILKFKPN